MDATPDLRPIDASAPEEIALVATRMRATLIEVLGERRGREMYNLDWLEARVRWHLDPACVEGAVTLIATGEHGIAGHVLLRVESDERGERYALISTIYVLPAARRLGLADALVTWGEEWSRARGLTRVMTYTDKDNAPLQTLLRRRGYELTRMNEEFVRLARTL
jgi:ribosomal protein S18 acetylase RimI-like enzyme